MDKQSTLYQLMGMRMNGITEQDENYQALLQEVDKYSGRLEAIPYAAKRAHFPLGGISFFRFSSPSA